MSPGSTLFVTGANLLHFRTIPVNPNLQEGPRRHSSLILCYNILFCSQESSGEILPLRMLQLLVAVVVVVVIVVALVVFYYIITQSVA